MRARVLLVCACICATLVMATTSAHGEGGAAPVHGSASGTGAIRFVGECPAIQQIEDGTLQATVLGKASYHTEICIGGTTNEPPGFTGTFLVTVRSGDTLYGTINGTLGGGPPDLPLQITGGTGRFARASGTLTLGSINQFDYSNCYPIPGEPGAETCFDWHETATISGNLVLGR